MVSLLAMLAACCHMYRMLSPKYCDVWCGEMNSAAESKSLHLREHYELKLNVKPVPVCPAGSLFPLFPSLKYSILPCTLTLCVVAHAINPITKPGMSTGEARATQRNSDSS